MKRNWIKVRNGLLDPKHIEALGFCPTILYLYILDNANWNDGSINGWKDREVAIELGVPSWKVREYRTRLKDAGYISCQPVLYGQDIVINKWMTPYDTGKSSVEPVNTSSIEQGNTSKEKGDKVSVKYRSSIGQVSETSRETSSSSIKTIRLKDIKTNNGAKNAPDESLEKEEIMPDPKKIGDVIDGMMKYAKQPDPVMEYPENCQVVLREFCRLWKMIPPGRGHPGYGKWIVDARELLINLGDGGLPLLAFVFRDWKASPRPFSVVSPGSIVNTVRAKAGQFVKDNKRACQRCNGTGYEERKTDKADKFGHVVWDKISCTLCGGNGEKEKNATP